MPKEANPRVGMRWGGVAMYSGGKWFITALKQFDRLISTFFGLVGGLIFAQFPQFIAQYLQRLGGHIDEARLAARLFRIPVLALRADDLATGLSAIEEAPAWAGLPTFLTHVQWTIAKEAWRHFTPGMTFAKDELLYLAVGALVGVVIYGIIKAVCHGVWKLVRYIARQCENRTNTTPPPTPQEFL